jgi:hypothetical protein
MDMGFSFSYEFAGSIVIVTARGTMNQQEALEIIASITADPRFRPNFGICFDVRETTYLPSFGEVTSFYHEYNERFRTVIAGKLAFIVANKIQFGIARMSMTLLSSLLPQTDVFLSKEDGLRWLIT